MPKVSIIVPVYGVEQWIERCAVSLFEQTYEDIEYVFVNDATQDKSMEVLADVMKRYPERAEQVKIVTHKQNMGLSSARNSGIEACTGTYVWHVDSDDYIALRAVKTLVEMAEKHHADIVIFDVHEVKEKGIHTMPVMYANKEDYIHRLLQHTEKCAHWNKFYRKALLDETGIRSDAQIRLAEDYAVTPRLLYCAERVVMLHEALYFYETRNQSSYVHNLSRTAIESQHRADKILVEFFADKDEYNDVIRILPQRSMTSMIKNTDAEGWQVVAEVYSDCLLLSGKGMTLVNRIIFGLVKRQQWSWLRGFMVIYHKAMGDRK